MLPVARVQHAMAGRTRLRIPAMRGQDRYFANLELALSRRPEVDRVQTRPRIGSVLIQHQGDLDALGRLGTDGGLFSLQVAPTQRPPLWGAVGQGIENLDDLIQRQSRGHLDLRVASLILLAAGTLVQVARGQILGPATNLLGLALGILAFPDASQEPGPEPTGPVDGPVH